MGVSEGRYFTYVIGEPGVGKSTLVATLTRGLMFRTQDKPFARREFLCGVVELGKVRESFSGTDALGMSVQPLAEEWLAETTPRLVLAEGDRLSNDKFFTAVTRLGYLLSVYYLFGPDVAAERRARRGSDQDPTWVKGRASKASRLAFDWMAFELDARLRPHELARQMDDPVSRTLREMQG